MKLSVLLLLLLGPLAACQADVARLTINGPDGKPIAGAQVRALEVKMQGEIFVTSDYTSDAKGLVTIESKGTILSDIVQAKKDQSLIAARVLVPGFAASVVQLKSGDNVFALTQGKTLEGVALDKADKPIANAELQISSLPFFPLTLRNGQTAGSAERLPPELAVKTTTDAQGHWKFDSVPLAGKVDIEASDARFKRENFSLDVSGANPTLHLTPGSMIKGRLLKPDGTPAAGVKISTNGMFGDVTTDDQGRFQVGGVGAESVRLQVLRYQQKLPFMVSPRQVEGMKEGEVRDIGDWKTEEGTKFKGRIVDAATKKPIESATIYASGQNDAGNGTTDKEGVFELLVPNSVVGLSVGAEGYVSYWSDKIPVRRNGVIDVGTVELNKGQKITGVVVDETGQPVGELSLYTTGARGERNFGASTAEDGSFTFGELAPGTYTVAADGLEFTGDTTAKVELDKAPKLRLTVKNSAGKGGKHELSGRVVDGEGAAVADANLAILVQRNGNSYNVVNVVSGADGNFKSSVTGLVVDMRVQSITHPSFLRDQEKIASKDGNWTLDVTVQKQGTLRGRVVNSKGQAVKGAFVGSQRGEELPVATDENGAFTLSNVPLKGASLLASDGHSLATFEVKGGPDGLEISLPEAAPIANKAALADQLLAKASPDDEWRRNWDVLGAKRLGELFNRLGGNRRWSRMSFVEELARRDPQALLAQEAELSPQIPANDRPQFELLLMQAKAGSPDAAQREQARKWLDVQHKEKRVIAPETVTRLLELAKVGARLDEQEGAMWLDFAAQISEQLGAETLTENAWQWSQLAAVISPDAITSLSENWAPAAQTALIAYAMRTWQADNNSTAAQKGWERLEKLSTATGPTTTPKDQPTPIDLRNQARPAYTQLLARTDPKAALALVSATEEYNRGQILVTIAREAVRLKQLDVAREALTTLFSLRSGDAEVGARGAGIAEGFDATFAATLWPQAYKQARPSSVMSSDESWMPTIATYAQERAAKWPGESRILIEREWAKRMVLSAKPAQDQWDPNARAMKSLAEAMASLNPTRAVEMAEKITETDQLRSQAMGLIATALLRGSQAPQP